MIVDRLEMARKLFENPKLKSKSNKGRLVKVNGVNPLWLDDEKNQIIQLELFEDETWEIIEPKLKEFCFGELQYILINKPYISYVNCKSVESGSNLAKLRAETTLEELKGKWTIEGYYEEDDNDKD